MSDQEWYDYFHSSWRTYAQERGVYPDAEALALYVYERDAITGHDGQPFTGDDLDIFVMSFRDRELGTTEAPERDIADHGEPAILEADPDEALTSTVAQPASDSRSPQVSVSVGVDTSAEPEASAGETITLTTVDRYYLAWRQYQSEQGDEPTDEQLSAHLAAQGMFGRGGKRVSPATLRRYFLPFRVYSVWAEHRMRNEVPEAGAVAHDCAASGITAQYNRPVVPQYVTENRGDFERRWQALTRYHADAQQ
ncbi:hypothetical protein [Streptomyces sp. NPDC088847]|uniref:hypothetical protein n=1 Tax=Streptomyces sp. NPDC088847 TaxID=3365909 RepID=UPI0038217910